jgi:hypothetical protein
MEKGIQQSEKYRTKDLHPSIKNMIENASATEQDKQGELYKKILSFYNSKMHGGLDIQVHQLFDDARTGNITFAMGILTNIWAGIFARVHKSSPGPFSPFLFSKTKAIGGDNNKDQSLLFKIFSSAKGGLMKIMDEVKALAKTTVTVPQDFPSLAYQLRAFTHATSFFFGDESILAIQLREFVKNIKGRHIYTIKDLSVVLGVGVVVGVGVYHK